MDSVKQENRNADTAALPQIIQGGMGVAISGSVLARAVAMQGFLGVVSGTAVAILLARRLQDGDNDGHLRRALSQFPNQDVAQEILNAYFLPEGREEGQGYRSVPMYSLCTKQELVNLTVVAAFVEVYLAKEGHDGVVGINLLEKIQLPNPATLYGAMLADVDVVLMGAGVPWEIPGILDHLVDHNEVSMALQVKGERGDPVRMTFDPASFGLSKPLKRPSFLAIIASTTLALALTKKATGRIDGFVIEYNSSGGHNAPPRGGVKLNGEGEPIYGPKDSPDLAKIQSYGKPFWLAGSYGHPEKLKEAMTLGAKGIQVGTLFAFCEESGFMPKLREEILLRVQDEKIQVRTDAAASPTSFPFKVLNLPDTLADPTTSDERMRRCDLGYLRHLYRTTDGKLVFRCPGEPIEAYLKKDGELEDTKGKLCLCNGLLSNVGLGQTQPDGYKEPPLVTTGKDMSGVSLMIKDNKDGYKAEDVLKYLSNGEAQQ